MDGFIDSGTVGVPGDGVQPRRPRTAAGLVEAGTQNETNMWQNILIRVPDDRLSAARTGGGAPNTPGPAATETSWTIYTAWKGFDYHYPAGTPAGFGLASFASNIRITNASLSVFCADCHNLNIAYKEQVSANFGGQRFGNAMHSDRSHTVFTIRQAAMRTSPWTVYETGTPLWAGTQCYTCHNNDMQIGNTPTMTSLGGVTKTWNNIEGWTGGTVCSNCKITPVGYSKMKNPDEWGETADRQQFSDFPHSGPSDGTKLLNAVTSIALTPPGAPAGSYRHLPYRPATMGLDAVCRICHGAVGREVGIRH